MYILTKHSPGYAIDICRK